MATPYDRAYAVLARTDLALPLEDVATIGGGGMLSTAPDPAQFVIAQLNSGESGGEQVLTAETLALMQRYAVSVPQGAGDLNQAGYGLGLGQLKAEPWNSWGHLYDMHGAIGNAGSWFGYSSQLWFAPKESGGYGIVLLVNNGADFEGEARDLWVFFGTYKMQVLLMEAAGEALAVQEV